MKRDDMKNRVIIALSVGMILCIGVRCKHDLSDLTGMSKVCFTEVKSIYAVCLQCHNGGELDFTSWEGIMKGITPNKPLKSEYYQVLVSEWGEIMPPDNPLSLEQRTKIRLWIEQGADSTNCLQDSIPAVVVPPPPMEDSICFNTHILPVLLSSCGKTGCHDATTSIEDLTLINYTSLISSGIIKPFNAAGSKFMIVATTNDPEEKMPPAPNAPLTSHQLADFTQWINEGALNSNCTSTVCDTINVSFATTLLPVINTNCKGCHSVVTPSNKGILLTSYANIKTLADNGKLYGAIHRLSGFSPMPPSYSLTSCQINQIDVWINAGAPNNK